MRLAELIVILELHQQGMTVSAIARRTGLHRSTVAKYIARGIEPPAYGLRSPRPTSLYAIERYLRGRIAAVPEPTRSRLYREIRGLGYAGGYTALKDFLRQVRPRPAAGFEIRFETPAGRQEQVDFADPRTVFTDGTGSRADRLVVLARARPQPDDVGPLRAAPGHADVAAVPCRRLRRAWSSSVLSGRWAGRPRAATASSSASN